MTATSGDGRPGPDEALRRRWWPEHPVPSERRAAKHRLTDTVREIVRAVSQLDVESAGEIDLAVVQSLADDLGARLGAMPDLSRHGGASSAPGDDGALFERSPLTGRSNPLATPLDLWFEGDRTYGSTIFNEAYEGPPGTVHGGFVISAFDDLLGVAQAASGQAGMTGTLSVRLSRPTPLHRRIDYEAGVTRVEGRKILAWGRSHHDGELLAEAEGVFIARRPAPTVTA